MIIVIGKNKKNKKWYFANDLCPRFVNVIIFAVLLIKIEWFLIQKNKFDLAV